MAPVNFQLKEIVTSAIWAYENTLEFEATRDELDLQNAISDIRSALKSLRRLEELMVMGYQYQWSPDIGLVGVPEFLDLSKTERDRGIPDMKSDQDVSDSFTPN